MFCYEIKKVLGIKKRVAIGILLALTSIYALYGMVYRSAEQGIQEPFLDFSAFIDSLGMVMQFIVIFIVSALYPMEQETGMTPMLLVTKYGEKNMDRVKVAAALAVTNLLVVMKGAVVFCGCYFAKHLNFDDMVSESYAVSLSSDPLVQTYGNIVCIQMIGFALGINFIALVCLRLSVKIQKSFVTAIVCALLCFIPGLIPESVPVLGILGSLSPMCLAGRDSTYRVLFQSGSYACTILHVGFLTYSVLIFLMIKCYQPVRA